jgi:hypothetical protein
MNAHSARSQAKRRAARRSREDGGVIFIVAMTLAVLGALGAFALQSAAMEIKTAGYERQNSQTHYLSEYGVLGAMQNVTPTTAQLFLNVMMTQANASCASLPGTSYVSTNALSKACIRQGSAQLGRAWPALVSASGTPIVGWTQGSATPGSLGIIPVTGDFYAEMTEPVQAPMIVGNDTMNGFCPIQFTISSYGLTQPSNAGSNYTALYQGEGLETSRARVVGGPVQWTGCGGK